MRVVRITGVVILAIVVAIAATVSLWGAITQMRITSEQRAIASFYVPPDPLTGAPGDLLRHEPLDVALDGGTVHRILYVSERPNGERAVSGGMVFIPDVPAPPEGRKVVAWAESRE